MEKTRHPLLRLWSYADGEHGRVIFGIVTLIVNVLVDIAPPMLIGLAVNVVVEKDSSPIANFFGVTDMRAQLVILAVITTLVWITESGAQYLYEVAWRTVAQRMQHSLRTDTFEHVVALDSAQFVESSTGEWMSVLNDDINQLERFLNNGISQILSVFFTVTFIGLGYLFFIPSIAIWALLPIPLIVIASVKYQGILGPRYKVVREKVGDLNAILSGALGGIITIKAFNGEKTELERLSNASKEYVDANERAIRPSSAFIPLIRMLILFSFVSLQIIGALYVLDGRLEVGDYTVVVFMTQRILWPLTRMGEVFDNYQRAMASTNRVLSLLDLRPSLVEGTEEMPEEHIGCIEFKNVSFAYADAKDSPVLKDMSFRINPGEMHAFVGPTGAGKSTITKLALRFYDPTAGVVEVDGVDAKRVPASELRARFGLVSQDVFLFHGTVAENIAYGKPGSSLEEVIDAAKDAYAHEFIMGLPDGYDTIVGERGQKLSGGQRQRVAIARAILRNPTILILDEATSAVDNETESLIQQSLSKVSKDRTSLVIAHRLSTITEANVIHVIDNGTEVERGTHEVLLEQDGIYAKLWSMQVRA